MHGVGWGRGPVAALGCVRKSLRPTAYATCAHNQTIDQKLSETDVRTGNWTLIQNHGLERNIVVGDFGRVDEIVRVGGTALVIR